MVELDMDIEDKKLTAKEVETARRLRLEAQHMQLIEGNPLDTDDIAMFEMFERERWSHERRRAYILDRIRDERASAAE